MIFATKIAGVPCKCEVIYHRAKNPVRLDYTGAWNPSTAPVMDVEFRILDQNGQQAPWLAKILTQEDEYRLMEEASIEQIGERYGYI